MADSGKASVWDAVWAPWGNPYTISGTATLDTRFPGQWYQLAARMRSGHPKRRTKKCLHYNWRRHYDPTLGRYTQPDPLGFVDGPSMYGYARSSPQRWVDPDGRRRPQSQPRTWWGPPPILPPYTPWPGAGDAPWWWSPWDAIKQCINLLRNPANDNDEIPDRYCKATSLTPTKGVAGRLQCVYKCADGAIIVDTSQAPHTACRPPILRNTTDPKGPADAGGHGAAAAR